MANYALRIGFGNSYVLTSISGSYSLTGQDVGLTYTPVGGSTTTIQPPAPVFATGASGSITNISWVAPTLDDAGVSATPSSYILYWGAWSSTTTGTFGPGGTGNIGTRPGIVGTSTTSITGLTAGSWCIVLASVNSAGTAGNPSTELIVTVT